MKFCLDTNVVSAMAKDDIPQESEAIGKIHNAHTAGSLDLWTSRFTGEEIGKVPADKRKPIEDIYSHLVKVPHFDRQKILGMNVYSDQWTCINSPMIEDDSIWVKLKETGLDDNDAYQLMLAIRGKCDAFVTADYKDFINNESRKSRIEQEYKIRLMTPTDLVNDEGL